MARKRPTWTQAMRRRAAKAGRKGNREGKRRGGQVGGLVRWHLMTAEEQEATRAMLAANRLKRWPAQRNSSRPARAAQRARGLKRWEQIRATGMSPEMAERLVELGIIKRSGVAVAVAPDVQVKPAKKSWA